MTGLPTAGKAREMSMTAARREARERDAEERRRRAEEDARLASVQPGYEAAIRDAITKAVVARTATGGRTAEFSHSGWPARDIDAIQRAARAVELELRASGYEVENRTHYSDMWRDPDDGMEFGPYARAILAVRW
jgi:predicted RNase H-like nuclease (RuvC/YqgF family)